MNPSILVIDDELDFLDSVRRGLVTSGFRDVRLEANAKKAAALFEMGAAIDLALIDVTMPVMNGVTLLEQIRSTSPDTECIMVTAVNDAKIAVECIKRGAYDYLLKPVSRDDLVLAVNRALERKRLVGLLDIKNRQDASPIDCAEAFRPIITQSVDVLRVLKEAELHAVSNVPVLVTGESGTGKELLARAVHEASPRADHPFTPVNMAALTGNLFESEFFGHTKGAFTGAELDRKGYLETTNGGTLFLDEIGHLPFELQGKLLRIFQEGEFMKLGKSEVKRTDVRFIAATNVNLDPLISKGLFRKDLYYRLKGAWLSLPPLRQRKEDIPLLVTHFVKEFGRPRKDPEIEEQALSLLMDYEYPGNIRELRSIIQSAMNLAKGRGLFFSSLPAHLRKRQADPTKGGGTEHTTIPPLSEIEKVHILRTYEQVQKNKAKTARLLGIGINTLRRKLTSYGVD